MQTEGKIAAARRRIFANPEILYGVVANPCGYRIL
jgi:hypothetical protein